MTKRVAVINDLSGFGKCSLTAAIAVLSVMGIQPCPMPTAILTNQSGFRNYQSIDFTKNMNGYIDHWQANHAEFDGIYSGYITNAEQINIISKFVDTFRKKDTAVVVDPVMADNGKIYKAYSLDMCKKMRDLVTKADYITPNLTELCFLTDNNYSNVASLDSNLIFAKIEEMAMTLVKRNKQTVIVTGVVVNGKIYNCIFEQGSADFIKSHLFDGSFSGTGDLFTSVFTGGIINGLSVKDSISKASSFLEKAIYDTISQQNFDPKHGVEFEKNLKLLLV